MKTWDRLGELYVEYRKSIRSLLPKNIVTLDTVGLHDAVVVASFQKGSELTMTLDATGALSKWSGHHVTLRFSGVANRVKTRRLVGQGWYYNEVHLSANSAFSLHVLLADDDIQIDADDVVIEVDV
jgi:hypothetical protein